MSDEMRRFEQQLLGMIENAKSEMDLIATGIDVVNQRNELLRKLWGSFDHSFKTEAAFFAWMYERVPHLQNAHVPSFSGIRPPEPPADLDDRTARLADQLAQARRVN